MDGQLHKMIDFVRAALQLNVKQLHKMIENKKPVSCLAISCRWECYMKFNKNKIKCNNFIFTKNNNLFEQKGIFSVIILLSISKCLLLQVIEFNNGI